MTPKSHALARDALSNLAPAPETRLSEWAEQHIVMPPGHNVRRTATLKMWPFMVEVLDAIGSVYPERVTLMKSARLGFTKGLVFAIAGIAMMDPCDIGVLLPTDDDALRFAVDDLEPTFQASPDIRGAMRQRRNNGRSTILRKQLMGGGSIKVLSGRAPRKLRAHDFRALFVDEADAIEITKEGDAIKLAERRTMAQSPRKIVIGGTPLIEGASTTETQYNESTAEIYEVPCPHCGAFNEILWENIEWDRLRDLTEEERADTAFYRCPHCREPVDESSKYEMVVQGRWRATKPDVKDHRGFRINALVSFLPNAKWPVLVAEYLKAKRGGPALMQPFVNLSLGLPYRTTTARVDGSILAGRVEPWGLAFGDRPTMIPAVVLLITAGVDVQPDRLEITLLGWGLERRAPLVLGKIVLDGNTLEPNGECWRELDKLSRRKWRNERGWNIGIDGMAVDSGGKSGTTQIVLDWCWARMNRRIYAIKGRAGTNKIKDKVWQKASKVMGDMRMFLIAVDIVKPEVMDALAREPFDDEGNEDKLSFRYSDQLDDDWFQQATNEVRKVHYVGLRAEYRFEPKTKGAPVEALDCLVYAWAVRRAPGVLAIDLHDRAKWLPSPDEPDAPVKSKPRSSGGDWASKFNT